MKTQNKTEIIKQTDRQTKINYLSNVGLFDYSILKEMKEEQLNELVEVAVKIKGY